METAEFLGRVTRRAGRRRGNPLGSMRTMARCAAAREPRVERLLRGRLLRVAIRALCTFVARARVRLVALVAARMAGGGGRRLGRVARRARGLLRRRVGRAVARLALGVTTVRARQLLLGRVAAGAESGAPRLHRSRELVLRVTRRACRAGRVERVIVLRLRVAARARRRPRARRAEPAFRGVRRVAARARRCRCRRRGGRRVLRRYVLVAAHACLRGRLLRAVRIVTALAGRMARHVICPQGLFGMARATRHALLRRVRCVALRARGMSGHGRDASLVGVARGARLLRLFRRHVRRVARRACGPRRRARLSELEGGACIFGEARRRGIERFFRSGHVGPGMTNRNVGVARRAIGEHRSRARRVLRAMDVVARTARGVLRHVLRERVCRASFFALRRRPVAVDACGRLLARPEDVAREARGRRLRVALVRVLRGALVTARTVVLLRFLSEAVRMAFRARDLPASHVRCVHRRRARRLPRRRYEVGRRRARRPSENDIEHARADREEHEHEGDQVARARRHGR